MFGETLKKIRKSKGITQLELANALSVSQPTIYMWENDRCEPGISMLSAICKFLGVSADYLLGRTDNPTPTTTPKESAAATAAAQGITVSVPDEAVSTLSREELKQYIQALIREELAQNAPK